MDPRERDGDRREVSFRARWFELLADICAGARLEGVESGATADRGTAEGLQLLRPKQWGL